MPVTIEIHPTAKVALRVVGIALVIVLLLLGVKRLVSPSRPILTDTTPESRGLVSDAWSGILCPMLVLHLPDEELEKYWSAALADYLGGDTEITVNGGRIDVLTDIYAIEVDRMDKWHEAIGQSVHYASQTGRTPCVAIILPSKSLPLGNTTLEKLVLIDKTCLEKGIKLVLLRNTPDSPSS